MLSLSPSHLKKYRDVVWLLLKYGRSDLVSQAGLLEAVDDGERPDDTDSSAGPDNLAEDLEQLGPTFVKLGQTLSTRSDMLPQPYLDALSRLQDNVQPVPFKDIEQVLVSELGVEISDVFAYFESEPLASASLGQVHRAMLTDGTHVAVKVQRPGIGSQVATDLDALDELAALLDSHTDFGKKYQSRRIVESLRRRILEELDYQNELNHCRMLSENLCDHELLVLPRVYSELSTSRVLTMQFLNGTKITELTSAELSRIDGSVLAEALFAAYLEQVLVKGVFHADPHPGNLCLLPDGRIGLMDFGMVERVPDEMRRHFAKLLLSVSEGHGEEAAREALVISRESPEADHAGFVNRIARLVAEHCNRPVRELEAGSIVLQIQAVAGDCGIHLPDELRVVGKTLLNLDRIVSVLDPDFDPNQSIRSHATEIVKNRMTDHLSLGRLYKTALESAELAQAAPERLNRITRQLADNEFRIKVDAIDQTALMQSLQKIANRITTGLLLAALIVGASLMMRLETSFTLFGYPGIAMLFFLIAACSGLVLVYRMAFSDADGGRS